MNAMPPNDGGGPTALRLALLRNGYHPVPITAPDPANPKRGKVPVLKNWTTVCAQADEAEVRRWAEALASSTNTGILLGELVGVDIDVPRADLAERLDKIAEVMIGATPLHRIGEAPKRLRCYRVRAPIRKIETPELFLPDGTKVQVEVLAEGQQFVGFGIHPSTGRPYTWLGESPDVLPLGEVPVTDEAALRDFVAVAEDLLRKAGGRTKKEIEQQQVAGTGEAAPLDEPAREKKAERKSGRESNEFFLAVNAKALAKLDRWFRHLFPKARHETGTGAWRVSSADLHRDLEEDLSMHPVNGGMDWGTGEKCSPIDVVIEWGGAADAKAAALWLCEKIGVAPADLGWKDAKPKREREGEGTSSDVPPDARAAEIDRLSQLSHADYQAERTAAAQALGMGRTVLDLAVKAEQAKRRGAAEARHRSQEAPGAGETRWPFGFFMDKTGLHADTGGGEPVWLCAPFRVLGQARDADGESWSLWLEWHDPDGRPHTWPMPARMLTATGGELEGALQHRGLRLNVEPGARVLLKQALAGVQSGDRVTLVSRAGWHAPAGGDATFVLPNGEAVGEVPEQLVLNGQAEHAAHAMTQAGSLEEWKNEVAQPLVGNPIPAFVVASGFAGPMLDPLGEPSGGFHFFGRSKTGKTLMLRLALSLWGLPKKGGLLRDWRSTANGLEAAAEECCDGLLPLDEVHQADPREVVGAIYALANESGKQRLRRDATAQRRRTWRTVVASTGEVDMPAVVAKIGQSLPAGAEVRLPSICVDGGVMWRNLHGAATPEAFMARLQAAVARCYGRPIRPFLEEIAAARANGEGGLEQAAAAMREHFARLLPPGADPQVHDVARRCALVALAGEAAIEWGILPWPKDEATRAAETVLRLWLGRRDGAGSAEESNHVRAVRSFLVEHGVSRFVALNKSADASGWVERHPDRPVLQRAGWRRSHDPDPSTDEYLIPKDAWQELCAKAGTDPVETAKTLKDAGFLDPGDGKNLPKSVRVPVIGKLRCYVVKPSIFAGRDNEEGGDAT